MNTARQDLCKTCNKLSAPLTYSFIYSLFRSRVQQLSLLTISKYRMAIRIRCDHITYTKWLPVNQSKWRRTRDLVLTVSLKTRASFVTTHMFRLQGPRSCLATWYESKPRTETSRRHTDNSETVNKVHLAILWLHHPTKCTSHIVLVTPTRLGATAPSSGRRSHAVGFSRG
jgi:hypothetical protein